MSLSDCSRKLTLSAICRDLLINFLPRKIIFKWLIKLFYGGSPDFIFLVHPRNKNDVYETTPLLKLLGNFFSEELLLKILAICPAYMVAKVKWKGILRGLVISTSIMPEDLFSKREDTFSELSRIVNFLRKISGGKTVYVGLAAWWPIVTNSGLAFKRILHADDNIVITNGHTATLLSIYLTINRICEITGLELSNLKILLVGVGKMGSAVAELLNGKVSSIGMIDRNAMRMKNLEDSLSEKIPYSPMKNYVATDSFFSQEMISILSEYDMVICTTSNVNFIIKDIALLKNCIVIDDSRPEAFPRIADPERNVVVLEGGLVKFKGIELDVDFGFGKKDNVFGCMAESIILALDGARTLKAVTGDVNDAIFNKMLFYCKEHDISEGDLKSGENEVTPELLCHIINNKQQYSYKNK